MLNIQLVKTRSLTAWESNPRERDPERFEWVKLSLRKFGFVMPIYARENGMLYSGHQRSAAALEIGMEEVPVVYLNPPQDEHSNRVLNMVFNVTTNDHATRAEFGKKAAASLGERSQFESLPDAVNPFPCLNRFVITPADYLKTIDIANVNNLVRIYANYLLEYGIHIPIILDDNDVIINGAPRLLAAIESGLVAFPAVRVSENTEALQLFLNKITMSFDLTKTFGDAIRYNSFFRHENQKIQRKVLGVGFYHWVFGKEATKGGSKWIKQHLTKLEGDYLSRWIGEHGTTVIDFGAGRLDNAMKLKAAGINCVPFEPYVPKPKKEELSFSSSVAIGRQFLKFIAERPHVDSLFVSSVFNSVPYKEDRDHLMVIFQAICMWGAKLYLHTLSDNGLSRVFTNGRSEAARIDESVMLDTEPGVYIVGILHPLGKVQKHHSKQELLVLGKQHFQRVMYKTANGASHGIKCEQPRPIDWAALVRAIEFEFDLPHPENRRLGLVDMAIDAFSKYTGQDLVTLRTELNTSPEPEHAAS